MKAIIIIILCIISAIIVMPPLVALICKFIFWLPLEKWENMYDNYSQWCRDKFDV